MLISPQAESLFTQALTLAPDDRDAFVRQACDGDVLLFEEVASLLTAANQADTYFDKLSEQVGLTALSGDSDDSIHGKIIGHWRLLRLIGRGGMGSVYLAERADGEFEKQVAIKILPIGLDNDFARARFLTERQILAQLAHENIATFLDAGVTEDGVPFFVMDYVEGTPIDVFCDEQGYGLRRRLKMVLDVSRGVQFAHQNLIIHRDLKPSNVIVGANGHVRLLDFGIAKVMESDANDRHLTQMAFRPVTPAYASPQMLLGEAVDVTTDVYSLGVILYQLLAKRLPLSYEGMSLAQIHVHAVSTQVVPVSDFCHEARGDIDAIINKALAKDPSERYQSVDSFAQDIRNYLEGMPVNAKGPSAWYRVNKFISRHKLPVAFATSALLGLTAFALLAGYSALSSKRQSEVIAMERDRAEATKEFLISIFDAAGPNESGADLTARQILDSGKDRIQVELAGQTQLQADLLAVIGVVYANLGLLQQWRDVTADEMTALESLGNQHSAEYLDVVIRRSQAEDLGGNYEAARNLADQAVTLSLALDDELGIAAARERLGRILHLTGKYDQAGVEYREALAIHRRLQGETHLATAQMKLHLSTLALHQERYQEAYDLIIEVKATRELLNADQGDVPTDMYLTLGKALFRLGRHDEAVEVYEKTFAANERLYGVDNSYNLYIVNALGNVAEDQGELEAAASYYEEALRLVLVHSPNSPNVGRASTNIGKMYVLTEGCERAIPVFQQALEVLQRLLPDHWYVGDAMWRLGQCMANTGHPNEAETLIVEAINILEERSPGKKEIIKEARMAARQLYLAWGKPYEATKFND